MLFRLSGPAAPRWCAYCRTYASQCSWRLEDQITILGGFERLGKGEAACAVVQEWRCEMLSP
jgi:hypothetical protein